MAVVAEIIRVENDKTISFGNYSLKEKKKVENFEVDGNTYKVKTHNELTKLEKNGILLFESVPGAAVNSLSISEKKATFSICGFTDTKITMELESETEYKIFIDSVNVGSMVSSVAGKISFSMGLNDSLQLVKIEKI